MSVVELRREVSAEPEVVSVLDLIGVVEMSLPLLITVEEVARLLSIGRSLAWQLVSDGQIQSVVLGKKRRLVRRSDLVAFVESLEVAKP